MLVFCKVYSFDDTDMSFSEIGKVQAAKEIVMSTRRQRNT